MYSTPSEGSPSCCIAILLVSLAFLLFYDVVFGKNHVGRFFSAILRLVGLRKSVELPPLPKIERPTRRQPPPPPRPAFRERMANLLSPARLWSSFLLILRLLKPVVFLVPLVMILTAVVCWLAGWRTIDEYANALVYGGIVCIIVALIRMGAGRDREWELDQVRRKYDLFAHSEDLTVLIERDRLARGKEVAALIAGNYTFGIRVGGTGILVILIGELLRTVVA